MFPAEMSDPLVAEELQADLGSAVIGREIIVLEQTSSTSDAILQISNADSKEGVVVFAEHQTDGRGQRGNRGQAVHAVRGKGFQVGLDAGAAAGVGAGDGEGAEGAGVGAGHESIVGSEDDELRWLR